VSVRVVVTGVGGGVGQSVIKGLRLANRNMNRAYHIVGVDSNPLAAGLYRADRGYQVPSASDEDSYFEALIEIMNRESAEVLIPGSDPEVVSIAAHVDDIESNTDAVVVVSPNATVKMCADKWSTFEFLESNGFSAPASSLPAGIEDLLVQVDYPLVVKPRVGWGSRGLRIVMNYDELQAAIAETKDPIIQEYLLPIEWKGCDLTREQASKQVDEYSTEVLADKAGKVLGSITNWREMEKGIPTRAVIEPFKEIRRVCEQIVAKMNVQGPSNLQARITEKGVTVFEVNARFSGSTAVRCVAGFNGPDMAINNFLFGKEITDEDLSFTDLVEMRYKEEVFIERSDYENMLSKGVTSQVGIIHKSF